MDKQQAISEFFKALRISLNNASAYPKNHPYYINSVNYFKNTVDELLGFIHPISIGILSDSLKILGEKESGKSNLFSELAEFFHQRKIKNFQIDQGVSAEELVEFLSSVALPKRDILRKGGVKNIANIQKLEHISFEELDYSQFLKSTNGDIDIDVWGYLFGRALRENNKKELLLLSESFRDFIDNLACEEIAKDASLQDNLKDFLIFLKKENKKKYGDCLFAIFKSFLKNKDKLTQQDIEALKNIFGNFEEEDFAFLLWKEVLNDSNFDSLGINLFKKIIPEDKENKIINLFKTDFPEEKELLKTDKKSLTRAAELLRLSKDTSVSEVYQRTLLNLVKELSFCEGNFLDKEALWHNYHFMIINILYLESNKEHLEIIMEKVFSELQKDNTVKDALFIRHLFDLSKKRKKEEAVGYLFEELNNRIQAFAEQFLWQEIAPEELEYIINNLEKSFQSGKFYLSKIFEENKINPRILKVFFRLFPLEYESFYKELKNKVDDSEFMNKVIESARKLNSVLGMEILKYLFGFSSYFIKIEIVKAMRDFQQADKKFLLSILESKQQEIRKEALNVLSADKEAVTLGLKILFDKPKFVIFKQEFILENMQIIKDLNLKEAKEDLLYFSKVPFFWNRKIRERALSILEGWDERKD